MTSTKCSADVLVQGDHRIAALLVVLQRRAVDDQDVHIAIVVVIEKRRSISVRLDDVVFGRSSADVHQRDPDFSGDIDEPGNASDAENAKEAPRIKTGAIERGSRLLQGDLTS